MDQFRAAIGYSAEKGSMIDGLCLDRLCAVGRCLALGRGGQLPINGQEDRLVFVANGYAKLVVQTDQNPSATPKQSTCSCHTGQILSFHFPGDIVSVLRDGRSAYRLIALSDLECIVFETDRFLDVAQDDPAVIRAVMTRSLEALHRSRARMMQMGHKSARQRVADFLVSIAHRVCGCTRGPCTFDLPMSRRDIGDSLGLTIETVSRQFADLRSEALIETQGRSQIKLQNIDKLKQIRGQL